MPKESVLTVQKKLELCQALAKRLPLSYACDLTELPRSTVYDAMKNDEGFRTQVAKAKAQSIHYLVDLTEQQSGGPWKILKNIGKEEFKEHVEIVYTANEEEELVAPDGTTTTDKT